MPFLSRLILNTRAPNGAFEAFLSSIPGFGRASMSALKPSVYRSSKSKNSRTPSPLRAEPKQTGNSCLARTAARSSADAKGFSSRKASSRASLAPPISSRVSSSASLPKSANTPPEAVAEIAPSVFRIPASSAPRSVSGRSILLTKIQVGTS